MIVAKRDKLECEIRLAHAIVKDAGQEGPLWRMTRKTPVKED